MLISDIETNGLLEDLDRVHCVVIKDARTGEAIGYADQEGYRPISMALDRLEKADETVGHNWIKFDGPALQKVYPRFKPKGKVTDTLVCTRLIFTDLIEGDQRLALAGKLPGRLIGAHSLEAWGYRMGLMKGEYGRDANGKQLPGIWDRWCPEMQDYMMQDGEVGFALWRKVLDQAYSQQAIDLEHRFAEIIAMQERRGFAFDVAGAQRLYAELVKKRLEIAQRLQETFKPKVVREEFIPKVNNKARGYVKGVPFIKEHVVEFNPSSRQMIAERLIEKGWLPMEYTPSGQPKIDETILSKLDFPEAAVLAEHFLVEKRIGQIAEGDQAWLRLERKGRIHGSVNTNGAVTGRCTHSNPNVAQVPKVGSPYGLECRSLFLATTGLVLVGADLAGVELRCLAHYMARYDGGAYGKAVVEGSSALGTDVHSLNARALGLDPKASYVVFGKTAKGRDIAKTFIYAFLYGAGDEKLGSIVGVSMEEADEYLAKQRSRWDRVVERFKKDKRPLEKLAIATVVKGGLLKARFLKQTPALARLLDDVKAKVAETKKRYGGGRLIALDGRILHVRSAHSALNTLLQNAGALIAKQATVFAYDNLSTRGYVFGRDWALVAHIHDELQTETKEAIADEVGKIIVKSMEQAGEHFKFRVPISGESKVGRNWADTH